MLLCKIGKEDSNLCSICNVVDHPEHFFFECIKIKQIWILANHIITEKINRSFRLSAEDILFNYSKNIFTVHSKFINYVIAVGKMCIGKFRYGDHPCLLTLFERELRIRKLFPGND